MDFVAARIAEAAGGRLVVGGPERSGPRRAVVDSRNVAADELFVGLPGERVDGGEFAERAIAAGCSERGLSEVTITRSAF